MADINTVVNSVMAITLVVFESDDSLSTRRLLASKGLQLDKLSVVINKVLEAMFNVQKALAAFRLKVLKQPPETYHGAKTHKDLNQKLCASVSAASGAEPRNNGAASMLDARLEIDQEYVGTMEGDIVASRIVQRFVDTPDLQSVNVSNVGGGAYMGELTLMLPCLKKLKVCSVSSCRHNYQIIAALRKEVDCQL